MTSPGVQEQAPPGGLRGPMNPPPAGTSPLASIRLGQPASRRARWSSFSIAVGIHAVLVVVLIAVVPRQADLPLEQQAYVHQVLVFEDVQRDGDGIFTCVPDDQEWDVSNFSSHTCVDKKLWDNCPNVPNPDQADTNGDGRGDACDPSMNPRLLADVNGDGEQDPSRPQHRCLMAGSRGLVSEPVLRLV